MSPGGGEPYLVELDAAVGLGVERVGGKAHALALLIRRGFDVPPGFVVTTDAHRIARGRGGRLPDGLRRALVERWRRSGWPRVAVRSSAVLEDRADLPINAIHSYSGFKADLYPLRPDDELRRSAFARRIKVELSPQIGEVYLHSPEDLILYKLWYYSLSQQTKHLRDITAIVIKRG